MYHVSVCQYKRKKKTIVSLHKTTLQTDPCGQSLVSLVVNPSSGLGMSAQRSLQKFLKLLHKASGHIKTFSQWNKVGHHKLPNIRKYSQKDVVAYFASLFLKVKVRLMVPLVDFLRLKNWFPSMLCFCLGPCYYHNLSLRDSRSLCNAETSSPSPRWSLAHSFSVCLCDDATRRRVVHRRLLEIVN